MALKGNLRDFTITQLLNLINLAKKTGTLVVEGANETALVSFRDGKLAFAEMRQEDNSLATLLYKANRFSLAQYRTLKTRAANMGDKELGLLLINAGYLTREEVVQTLRNHFVAVVNRLFTWVEGFFQFQNDALPPDDRITTRIDLENIIIEGSRRLREWEQLQDEIPNLDMALRFTDRPGTNLSKVNLSIQEWKVVSYINPKNSIRQISRATQMNDIEIRRIVYGLLQAGLVDLVRPENAPHPLKPTGAYANASQDEQKSLINRIIGRIRSL
ncbi:MAG TPA: DUF4388 domain-containing protein [Anaerolineales bacterium]|nr:DUF4388 domain-containing protein [Anaerolineales bacterium]